MKGLKRGADENAAKSLVLNLATGRGRSVLETVQAAEIATGRQVRRSMQLRRAGDPPVLIADPAKALSVLRWTATRNLADIISRAWAWMEKPSQRRPA
ncbi:MAG TPA: hypothetical protein VIH78_11980 [Terriglobales bacterium]